MIRIIDSPVWFNSSTKLIDANLVLEHFGLQMYWDADWRGICARKSKAPVGPTTEALGDLNLNGKYGKFNKNNRDNIMHINAKNHKRSDSWHG